MPRTPIEIAPSITVRDETGELVETSLRDVSFEAICRAQPYRTFRWYLGQRHYSGHVLVGNRGRSRDLTSRGWSLRGCCMPTLTQA
jgi:hypothetical protein